MQYAACKEKVAGNLVGKAVGGCFVSSPSGTKDPASLLRESSDQALVERHGQHLFLQGYHILERLCPSEKNTAI
jgi:hypothetical protein